MVRKKAAHTQPKRPEQDILAENRLLKKRIRHLERTQKRTRKKNTAAAMLQAASSPAKRAVMTKVWNRRRKRVDHAAALLRLGIRYLNARDRVTIFRK